MSSKRSTWHLASACISIQLPRLLSQYSCLSIHYHTGALYHILLLTYFAQEIALESTPHSSSPNSSSPDISFSVTTAGCSSSLHPLKVSLCSTFGHFLWLHPLPSPLIICTSVCRKHSGYMPGSDCSPALLTHSSNEHCYSDVLLVHIQIGTLLFIHKPAFLPVLPVLPLQPFASSNPYCPSLVKCSS